MGFISSGSEQELPGSPSPPWQQVFRLAPDAYASAMLRGDKQFGKLPLML